MKEKFGRNFYLLVAVNILTGMSMQIITPVLTKYLTSLGNSLTTASVVAGLYSITALCVRPFTGSIIDKNSFKKILYIFISFLGITLMGFFFIRDIRLMGVLRVLNGLAFCFNSTAIAAFAYQSIPASRMGEGIGYLGMGNILATAVGPGIGASVGAKFGYNYSFLIAGCVCLLALLILPMCKEEKREPKLSGQKKEFNISNFIAISILPLAFLNGLFSFANGTISNFLVLHSESRGIGGVSIYFTVIACILVFLRPALGKLNDKKGLAFILQPAYVFAAAGMFLIGAANSLWMILLAAPFMAFGQGGGQPACQTQCVKELGKERAGVATSTYYIFADVFQGFGPMISGAIAEKHGYNAAFNTVGFTLLVGLLLFEILRVYKKKKGQPGY